MRTLHSEAADCPFCTIPAEAIVVRNDLCFAIRDADPVARGHMLIAPFRHVASYFDTTFGERVAVLDLVEQVRDRIDAEYAPDGYNVGVNIGAAAGQSVMHVHFHVIPRYRGDTPHPGGGIRNVLKGSCG